MLLLAVDTATPAVTVALHDGESVVAESNQVDARRHGELLLPSVDKVLAEAGVTLEAVTGVVVGVGPGPYTGLRVGLVTASTFAAVLGVPVHGLCTLDGLAYAAGAAGIEGPFTVATDARRKEVYWARYEDPRTRVGEPAVDRPADIAEQVAGLTAVGQGALLYPEVFQDARGPEHQSAAALASLAAERLAAGLEFLPPTPCTCAGPTPRCPRTTRWSPRSDPGDPHTVREMRWWDIGPVLELEHELFPEDAWSAGMFWSELAHARGPQATRRYVVAETPDGRLVGYAGLAAAGDLADVQTIAAARDQWGTGLGARLLTDLLRAATAFECAEVLLEVRVDNTRAQKLYERFGFEPIGFRRGYYQPGNVDALVMRLTDPAQARTESSESNG